MREGGRGGETQEERVKERERESGVQDGQSGKRRDSEGRRQRKNGLEGKGMNEWRVCLSEGGGRRGGVGNFKKK